MELNKQEKREFEVELHSLYPFLSDKESKNIIEDMIVYWSFIIENIEEVSK
jgi:hypothetical protein